MTKAVDLSEDIVRQLMIEKKTLSYFPASAYRLQLNKEFTLRDAQATIPYLKSLGIEAVYLSPIFEAVPGSLHGYNITNPGRINPEIGSPEEFAAFSDHLKSNGIGLILDVVPNHMGIGGNGNPWWTDVLENGPSSIFANFFDIDWDPAKKELKDKVLLPVLGDQYGLVLENQELLLFFDEGAFFIRYYDRRFPISPDTYPLILEYGLDELKAGMRADDPGFLEYLSVTASLKNLPRRDERSREKVEERNREKEIAKGRLKVLTGRSDVFKGIIESRIKLFNGQKGTPESFDLLDNLLNQQSYRLTYWRAASDEINYRRFFDINELAAIRIEDPEVFDAYHALIFDWIRQGRVQGLRIDHPDGLYDPVAYFKKIQQTYLQNLVGEELSRRAGEVPCESAAWIGKILGEDTFAAVKPLYIVVEKILDRREYLPENWAVQGTVGYDFLNALNGLFILRSHENNFERIYENWSGPKREFEDLLYEKKKFFAAFYMASEVNTLAHHLDRISEKIRRYRDFTLNHLATAIREVIACFPVYRTYIRHDDDCVSERDQKYIQMAIGRVKSKHPTLNPSLFDFLKHVLLGTFEEAFTPRERILFREFVLRFQQLTGPIMAKGLEDTVFYIYNRFISLNEVGGDPQHFGYSLDEFHAANLACREKWPFSFITSSTHDTKRSEDVRMRLDVLSEIPDEWRRHADQWAEWNEKHKKVMADGKKYPERNTEYFLYQSLLGVWPNEPLDDDGLAVLRDRICDYSSKAVREAKTYTNWMNPNAPYEEAVKTFVSSLLSRKESPAFLDDFIPFQKKISGYGMLNSLSALVVKAGSPGASDYYQGTGVWDYSLVDPDNRRPVDYGHRKDLLRHIEDLCRTESSLEQVARDFLKSKEDGRIKLFLLWKVLNMRTQYRDLFLLGDYFPLRVEGEREQNVVAFMRKRQNSMAVILCGRFFTQFIGQPDDAPAGEGVWKRTAAVFPAEIGCAGTWVDVFTRRRIQTAASGQKVLLPLADAFHTLSVAILMNEEGG